ncbi:MAG TPA: hypothetical protein VMW49_09680 [Candidatus Dormibacteraeota bacterium]|nr:hypothetical protein [Candidatus Dormibacteraeota bacterium]
MTVPKPNVFTIGALIVGLGAGFGARALTAPAAAATPAALSTASHSVHRGHGHGQAGLGIVGTVASVVGPTLEIQGPGGQTTVRVTSTTKITQTVKADLGAIATGDCLRARGPADATGAITARTVAISPAGPNGCRAGGARG